MAPIPNALFTIRRGVVRDSGRGRKERQVEETRVLNPVAQALVDFALMFGLIALVAAPVLPVRLF